VVLKVRSRASREHCEGKHLLDKDDSTFEVSDLTVILAMFSMLPGRYQKCFWRFCSRETLREHKKTWILAASGTKVPTLAPL
jgi:uncharacterized protein YfaT (DUF1175 family)